MFSFPLLFALLYPKFSLKRHMTLKIMFSGCHYLKHNYFKHTELHTHTLALNITDPPSLATLRISHLWVHDCQKGILPSKLSSTTAFPAAARSPREEKNHHHITNNKKKSKIYTLYIYFLKLSVGLTTHAHTFLLVFREGWPASNLTRSLK